jgi:hypothetical protein
MIDEHLEKLKVLSDQEIGEKYFTIDELADYISAGNTFWRFAVAESEEQQGELTDPQITVKNKHRLSADDTIVGFIWGRVIPVRVFTGTRFSLPQLYSDEKVIFEVPTWVVQEKYQDYSIGTLLIKHMTDVILEAEVYPVISPVRKSEGESNKHLFFLSQYGTKTEVVPDKPTDVICSICGEDCSCQTVILRYSEDDISKLHQDCRETVE